MFFAIPNGGTRNVIEASRMKQSGTTKGVPDLQFVHNGKTTFFELKREKGSRVSEEQKKFISDAKKNKIAVYLIKTEKQFIEIFLNLIYNEMKPFYSEDHIRQSYTDLLKIYEIPLAGMTFPEWQYQNKVWTFIFEMELDSRIIISDICEKQNIEKFTSLIRKFIVLEMDEANGFTLQFSADYSAFQKLKKFKFDLK
jgi:hypothetical protein